MKIKIRRRKSKQISTVFGDLQEKIGLRITVYTFIKVKVPGKQARIKKFDKSPKSHLGLAWITKLKK